MDTSPTASISAWASISLADEGQHACEMRDEVEVQFRLVIPEETRLRCEVLLWSRLIHLACSGRLEKPGALQHIEVNSRRMETTNQLKNQGVRLSSIHWSESCAADTFTWWPPHSWKCSVCQCERLFISKWERSGYFFLFQWLYPTLKPNQYCYHRHRSLIFSTWKTLLKLLRS